MTAVVLAVVVLAAYSAVRAWQGHDPETSSRVLVATAVPGATNSDLLRLERTLVGWSAVPIRPGRGLPDVSAFHRAGIAAARVDGARLTVTLLPQATATQADRVRAAMLGDPVVGDLVAGLDLPGVRRSLDATRTEVGSPPGMSVTAVTGRGWWAHAAGVADRRTGRPMSPALLYRIGSATKTFTAVLVLQLVEEGKVRLDEPISTYLPGVLPYRQQVTIRQLLSHTSGLVDTSHFGSANVVPARDVPRVRDPRLRAQAARALRESRTDPALTVPLRLYLAVVTTRPLAFRPGSTYTYSNTDYVVLTLLVEHVTGRSLAEELQRRIIEPLGLRHTFLATDASFPEPFARSYAEQGHGALVDATNDLALGTTGSGDIVSTPADVAVFFRALLGGHLLPASLLAQMRTPSPASVRRGTPYGFALEQHRTPCGVEALGHGGAIGGYLTDVYATENGETVSVYVQTASGTADLGALREHFAGTAFCEAQGGR